MVDGLGSMFGRQGVGQSVEGSEARLPPCTLAIWCALLSSAVTPQPHLVRTRRGIQCYAIYATSSNWNNEEGTTVTGIDANADPTSFLPSSSAAVLTKMHCRPISPCPPDGSLGSPVFYLNGPGKASYPGTCCIFSNYCQSRLG